MSRFLPFLFYFISALAQAQPKVIYFGSGGENSWLDRAAFDSSLNKLSSYAKGKNLAAEYFYSADPKQIKFATETTGKALKEFSGENWQSRLSELQRDIEGDRAKGSILLVLDTHGSDESGEFVIATSDGSVAPKSQLKNLIASAENKGVKLAIVLGTCMSGSMLDLGTDRTCVITGSKPDQYAVQRDSAYFYDHLSDSDNLEEAFLKARAEGHPLWGYPPSQPQMSSPAGMETAKALSLLDRFIVWPDRTKLRARNKSCFAAAGGLLAKYATQFDEVEWKLASMGYDFQMGPRDIAETRALADEYEKVRQQFLQETKSSETSDQVCFRDAGNNQYKGCANSKAELRKVQAATLDLLRKAHLAGDEEKERRIKNSLDDIQALIADPKNDGLGRFQAKSRSNLEGLESQLNSLTKKISARERRLYQRVYAQKTKELAGKPNPCADFKLN